jgi:hypothetical protein
MIIKFLQSPDAEQEQAESRNPSTIPRANSAAAAGFIDAVPTFESSHIVAAYLSEADYRLARRIVPEMRAFKDYEDWLDFRVGMFWGLGMAGFTVDLISVDLAEFAQWRRTTSTAPSISALDRFARSRDLRVLGHTNAGLSRDSRVFPPNERIVTANLGG